MKRIQNGVFEFEKEKGMRVPLRLYASDKIHKILEPGAIQQGKNVAYLPGIKKYSIMLSDAHYGYGFPVGGVAAFGEEDGVVSPGGIGYDINCGMRLLKTGLSIEEVKPKIKEIMSNLFKNIPSGLGSTGKLRLTPEKVEDVLSQGAEWAVDQGYGSKEDLLCIEENGRMQEADPRQVGEKARKRGLKQLGTLGSGNHFLEVQEISEIYDKTVAEKFGLGEKGQAVVMLHCGSRGLGHQVCDDYIHYLNKAKSKFGIELPDRQLICAPLKSKEGNEYISAMQCAVNYAFCNRQVMTQWVRDTFENVFKDVDMPLVYDVCHNIGKWEEHEGERLFVHRKGATRAFPAGRKELSKKYIDVGQPVIIPGSMGTASYVMLGTEKGLKETFGSAPHGAGRVMSRSKAVRTIKGEEVQRQLEKQGKVVFSASKTVLAEEAPLAYKDIAEVIRGTEESGIAKSVVCLLPLGTAKG